LSAPDGRPGRQDDAGAAPGHRLGQALVGAQFALIALLAWLGGPALLGAVGAARLPAVPVAAGWLLVLVAVALGGWALTANRPGNFRVHPAPHARGRLVQSGPYRWIRHPMYTSVLAAGAGCALATAGPAGAGFADVAADTAAAAWRLWLAGLAWFVLAAVLAAKASLEERWLVARHPGYAAYRARTRRFVPGLY
jgi:protein-S-isoprenylcysteine O-methyltransferase Ste14